MQATSTQTTERNRYVDFLRVTSIGVVVLGHWLMAVVSREDGGLSARHLLDAVPSLQYLTWVFQVMPIFFVVGGFANAASWESARRRGVSYPEWLRARAERLLRPTAVFVAVWIVLAAALARTGIDHELLRMGAQLVAVPLWFLAVYLFVVPLAPLTLAAHRRFGVAALAMLVAGAAVVDLLSWGVGVPVVGWINFAFVWLAVHQLGYLWRDGALTSRPAVAWAVAAGGLTALVALVALGPYPASMVGVDEGGRTNNTPPSLALVALGLWQTGLLLAVERPLRRWLDRPAVWARVIVANGVVMTVFLWHLTAMAFVALAVYPTGIWPSVSPLGVVWWTLRPVWVAVLAAALVPLVLLFAPVERLRRDVPPGPPLPAVLLGAAGACIGLALFALRGFFVLEVPWGLPLPAAASFFVGMVLLRLPARRKEMASGVPGGGPP